MLQRSINHHAGLPDVDHDRRHAPQHDAEADALMSMLRSVRRNLKMIAVVTVAGTVIAAAVVLGLTPKYRATVTVLVDSRQTKILQDAEVVGRPGTDNGAIESEVELLKSDRVMREVAQRLDLKNDPEFSGGNGILSLVKTAVVVPLRALFGNDGEDAETDELAGIVARLDKETDAKRRGLTYVIELNAWSQDPAKAARIANMFATVYLDNQLAAKADATQRASSWLASRSSEQKEKLEQSERALEAYKAKNGLFNPGGENLSDRQVSQLNDQLVDARARAAEARAKYERLRQVTPERLRSAAASPDVLQSQVVSNLRGQYADIVKQQAEREARYGAGHPMVVAGRAQLGRIEGQITQEIQRIVSSAKTEFEMAKSREASLEASLDELKARAAEFNQASIKMHELEREVEANRNLYEAFLSRAKQTAALNLQIPDSRIVSQAEPPPSPSFPRRGLSIALALIGSLGLGIALALARSAFGKGFRSSAEVETMLGLQPLASIPLVDGRFGAASLEGRTPGLRALAHRADGEATRRADGYAGRLAGLSLKRPNSPFAESIRALYLRLRRQASEGRIGVGIVVSALPHEGKSTVAANLARVAARAGEKVLLIDGDLRKPSVAAALGLSGEPGLAEVLAGESDLGASVKRDPASGLYVIGGMRAMSGTDVIRLLASGQMTGLMQQAREAFELVIVDTSPMLAAAEADVLVDLADFAVLVVASERTSRDAVLTMLSESPDLERKIAGVVLNGTSDDFRRYDRYGGYRGQRHDAIAG
ncbi:MAG: GumC family protein [Xanthobacteraceae bacterium]|uniref:GumC family protein n=1 Tax=Pseudolabrys sp. TaxID=1960880 RepID=UPI003D11683F